MGLLEHFGHLQEDVEEPKGVEQNSSEEKAPLNSETINVQRENIPDSELNIESVNEIVFTIREAINTIRNEGEVLQVFAIEYQGNIIYECFHSCLGNIDSFRRRVEMVFSEVRQLLSHPLREELYKMVRRLERSRIQQYIPLIGQPTLNMRGANADEVSSVTTAIELDERADSFGVEDPSVLSEENQRVSNDENRSSLN